jgi:aminoglycoside 6-adenylyltransferase
LKVENERVTAEHHDDDEIVSRLIRWAEQTESVRAILLTSTRAQQGATVDVFSDYDVVLVVGDIHSFWADRSWVGAFGDVLVTYWDPIYPESEHGIDQTGNVIQYADGLKIDFRLWPVDLLREIARAPALPVDLDAGYRVLLDKDGLAASLPAPTHRAYIPPRPTEAAYHTFVEEFFSDAPYVAKFLCRGDLLPAKWCLDHDMKHAYLRPMLEWYLEREHGWSLPVRDLGKGLNRLLPADLWQELTSTYAGGGVDENWDALFRTMALFRSVALDVADDLGYTYPDDLDRRVTVYVQAMRAAGPETKG